MGQLQHSISLGGYEPLAALSRVINQLKRIVTNGWEGEWPGQIL